MPIPSTPGSVVPSTPGQALIELQSPCKVSRKVADFYGSSMPRPALLGDPYQPTMEVVKSQRGRVEFVSAVQPLMGELAALDCIVEDGRRDVVVWWHLDHAPRLNET
jgi:hypothetical protein